jgi:hypothetical protein
VSAIEIAEGERNLARIVQSLISLFRKWNASGQVTLRPGFTFTVVTKAVSPGAVNVAKGDEVMLSPRTANAAAAIPTTYVSAVEQGTFTLAHANNVQADKTFGWGVR